MGKSLIIILALATAGCAVTQPPAEVTKTRNIFIEPSSALTKDCEIAPPPDKATFMAATPQQRQDWLHDYARVLQSNLKQCNKQWATVRDWYDTNRKLYTQDNAK